MPSVGMRHSTKAFLPKSVGKDGESVTILLRSGEIAYYKSNGWRRVTPEQGVVDVSDMDIEEEPQPQQPAEDVGTEVEMNESGEENANVSEEKRFKNVYDRKRRRSTTQTKDDRLYGTFYTRKRSRNKGLISSGTLSRARNSGYAETAATSVSDVGSLGQGSYPDPGSWAALDVLIEDSPGGSFRFTRFFSSVLKFTRGSRVALRGLAAFMCSKPIVEVFSGHGVHFKPGILSGSSVSNDIRLGGFCRIFGDQTSVPLFWLNCRAAPQSFINLHTTLILRSLYHRSYWKFLRTAMNVPPILPDGVYYNQTDRTVSVTSSAKKNIPDFGGQGFELDQKRISIGNAAFQSFKRKRSSLRSKRPYSSLSTDLYGLQHFNAINKLVRKSAAIKNPDALDLDTFRTIYSRHTPSANLKSNMKQINLSKKISQNDRVVKKATLVGSGQNMDSTYCSANVLVIESDRCYREEGVTIMLESSVSKVWHLVVKSHGTTKFMHQAIDGVRNCSTNRYTHASIWTAENSWKLEFCDRKDLVIFKELYKECAERNTGVTSANSPIPVPGVREVLDYDNGEYTRFLRPDSYITASGNEVTRALAKNTTIYEMSQDDEEWLEMLNSGVTNVDNDTTEYLSAEKFEKIIDMFEKNAYLNPGDISDQGKFTSLCSDMGRDDIIVAVYEYWLQKRKQKRAALLSVFESPPPKRPPVEKQTVCRKKRSVKRHPSQNGRDRQRLALRDQKQLHRKSAEENLSDEEISYDKLRRVEEEAVSNAERSAKVAISKRAKAQMLMANADRAVYLAIKALRIAEIAQQAESSKAPDGLVPTRMMSSEVSEDVSMYIGDKGV